MLFSGFNETETRYRMSDGKVKLSELKKSKHDKRVRRSEIIHNHTQLPDRVKGE